MRMTYLPSSTNTEADALSRETANVIERLWGELLPPERRPLRRDLSFFAAGGTSLQAMALAAQLEARFGVAMTVVSIIDHPTLSDLATYVTERRRLESVEEEGAL
jgi:acyl carrier protein